MTTTAPARVRTSAKIAALAAVLALAASACGSSAGGASAKKGPGYDLAAKQILDPTSKPSSGKITMTYQNGLDSLDPGNTYRQQTWNLYRTFGRGMLAWAHKPGTAGEELQADLATGPGIVSDNGLTWTYKLRPGATYENGQKIVAKDVKWAIERSNWDHKNHGRGPSYFANIMTPDSGKTAQYANWNVYEKGDLPDSVIAAPDDQTLVFHLPQPFGEFDYLMTMPETFPVPWQSDKSDPVHYAEKPLASGAYKIQSYSAGKELVLVKNDAFNAGTDPNGLHVANVQTIDVKLAVAAAERDQMLLSGQADIDLGAALGVATHAQVLTDDTLKSQTDDYADGSLTYAALNTTLLDVHCRKAIEYGIDKEAVLNMYGGPYGGTVATSMLTDPIPGHVAFDPYGGYQPVEAKKQLAQCSSAKKVADGTYHLVTNIAAQSNHPDVDNAATAMQASLKTVGIDADIQLIPSVQYFSDFAGEVNYANNNNLGIMLNSWAADWPSGYGFMEQIVSSDGVQPPGVGNSTNLSQYKNKEVDALFVKALATTNAADQQKIWVQIDRKVMDDAIAVPLVQNKQMAFRSSRLANVMYNGGVAGYDLSVLGLK